MPVETLRSPVRQPVRTTVAATPPRLRPKGPVGPGFFRQCPAAESKPKQSAVERLEADKAKYVKSRVALSKQQPVRPPEVQKPLLSPSTGLRPTRKTPTQTKTNQEGVQLDLAHLSNLISGVNDGPQSNATVSSEDSKVPDCATTSHRSPCPTPAGAQQKKERPCPPPRPDWSSPAKVRLKASGLAKVENPGSPGSPASGTVRRVDVMPQTGPVRTPCRPSQFIRQPLQPIPLHFQFPLRSAASQMRLFHPRTTPGSSPLKPVVAPSKPENPPSSPAETPLPAPPPPSFPAFPPPSPAITRLSSSSSRKRPSLTRSKSDMSDRYSRAGTDLERFFNLCGLDPADLQELTGSSSDIVSLARFRSVSAPGSECAGSGAQDENNDEEEEGDDGNAAERVPYNVSVIERNARVIKWLYGIRQAKDNASKSTNL
ncbi:protein FAM110B [Toxotes jaculatrix]|uniref:protein FAM110B n=1 Tax=Toxotes jaculatrix TaxID=941984 RepID=UPI001B3A7BF7|nr:protein FAM110B [Toxotes jaculatrix]